MSDVALAACPLRTGSRLASLLFLSFTVHLTRGLTLIRAYIAVDSRTRHVMVQWRTTSDQGRGRCTTESYTRAEITVIKLAVRR